MPPPSWPLYGHTVIDAGPADALCAAKTVEGGQVASMSAAEKWMGAVVRRARFTPSR